ncbi:signal recognition particle-docking protein FtsY [Beutenbergia cavernae DSM 12333]|uniref:Signal recognition particle receptor FtsY n=1 Tax=Beutenbergia cavernae (strain ATCC BAA-8 / DSM 12333 / CCUG 43141 / JCM 11478 / NBRC 16432 / NCIMB 13614 / HKI 0122) TaxID=471853 RepID=C5BWX8_BEUC1|nr:signal recognition particle-docking protein FtsY [Beutenbergia cavernae]ACQ80794.1 signal recognition particle-docking protein FtsY [Beutenbergia cavernae DSM 12333]
MTDQTWFLPAVLGVVLVLLVVGVVLLAPRRRRRGQAGAPPHVPTAQAPESGVGEEPEGAPEGGRPGLVDVPLPETAAPSVEGPEPVASRLVRLRDRLARSGSFGQALLGVLARDHIGEGDWEELEDTLLAADLGVGPTTELMESLRTRVRVLGTRDADSVRALLRELLLAQVDPAMDRALADSPSLGADDELHPATVLVVGVNGTGKTTTVGKLARLLVASDRDVVLGAADTFRAAAADQLATWGSRVGVPVIRADRYGADPASVAFEAVRAADEAGADVVIVDTAGRLQNKAGLMDELGKIARVASRRAPIAETLLVLDATTGQNGLRQARVFAEVVPLTGIVLTKLDGSAKGGIVVAVQRELGVPVKFVGLGEGPDDLAPFEPDAFVDALLA